MAERREVATRSEGSVFSHHRGDPVSQERRLKFDDVGANTGTRHRQAACPEENQRADHLPLDHITHTGRMRTNEGHLKFGRALGRDHRIGERPESGGDAVDGLVTRNETLDQRCRCLHVFACDITELDVDTTTRHCDDIVDTKSELLGVASTMQRDAAYERIGRCRRGLRNVFHSAQDFATLCNMPQGASPDTPRATDRGLSLVRSIADNPQGLTLADLARNVELSPSTTLRQVRALEAAGFAMRRSDGAWVPGAELLRLARSLTAHATLPRLAEPVLATLADATGESAYLAEPVDASAAVYVAMESGRHSIRHVSWLGHTISRAGTALGRALVGDVDDDGVAVKTDAVEQGITAVSAPVRDAADAIVGALSVVGPSFRLVDARLAEARSQVATHAVMLSRLAGHTPVQSDS